MGTLSNQDYFLGVLAVGLEEIPSYEAAGQLSSVPDTAAVHRLVGLSVLVVMADCFDSDMVAAAGDVVMSLGIVAAAAAACDVVRWLGIAAAAGDVVMWLGIVAVVFGLFVVVVVAVADVIVAAMFEMDIDVVVGFGMMIVVL